MRLWHNSITTIFAFSSAETAAPWGVEVGGRRVLGLSQSPPMVPPSPSCATSTHAAENPSVPLGPVPPLLTSPYLSRVLGPQVSSPQWGWGSAGPVHGSSGLLTRLGFSEHTDQAGRCSSVFLTIEYLEPSPIFPTPPPRSRSVNECGQNLMPDKLESSLICRPGSASE